MVYLLISRNLQIKCKYNIEDDNNVKLPLAYIRKIINTAENVTSVIDKTILSTKAIIDKRKSNVHVEKI